MLQYNKACGTGHLLTEISYIYRVHYIMIRYLALLFAFAASPFITKGQTNMHHEVGLGYGYFTKEQFHNGIFDLDKSYSGLSEQESIVSELYEGAGVKP